MQIESTLPLQSLDEEQSDAVIRREIEYKQLLIAKEEDALAREEEALNNDEKLFLQELAIAKSHQETKLPVTLYNSSGVILQKFALTTLPLQDSSSNFSNSDVTNNVKAVKYKIEYCIDFTTKPSFCCPYKYSRYAS